MASVGLCPLTWPLEGTQTTILVGSPRLGRARLTRKLAFGPHRRSVDLADHPLPEAAHRPRDLTLAHRSTPTPRGTHLRAADIKPAITITGSRGLDRYSGSLSHPTPHEFAQDLRISVARLLAAWRASHELENRDQIRSHHLTGIRIAIYDRSHTKFPHTKSHTGGDVNNVGERAVQRAREVQQVVMKLAMIREAKSVGEHW